MASRTVRGRLDERAEWALGMLMREQGGARHAVVLQADGLLALSTVIVAPTSRSALAATFRPEIEVAGVQTRVLVEQLRAVDAARLGEPAGVLSAGERRELDDALALVLDLR